MFSQMRYASPSIREPTTFMERTLTISRNALGIEKKTDILHHIRSLPSEERLEAAEKIKNIEREAMTHQQPQPGLVDLMDYLHDAGVRRALCTRNFECVYLPRPNLWQKQRHG